MLASTIKRSFSTIGRKSPINKQELTSLENTIKYSLGSLISPLYLLGLGWFNIPYKHKGVIQRFGKYTETVDEEKGFTLQDHEGSGGGYDPTGGGK